MGDHPSRVTEPGCMSASRRRFHVSERGDIDRFEPRLPLESSTGISQPVVWALAESHLVNYLVPRDCPRVTFHAVPSTCESDRARFLAGDAHVVAIEVRWLERLKVAQLWLYELPPETFASSDVTAGYFTSEQVVVPMRRTLVERLPDELSARGASLRVLPNLQRLACEIAASSLAFSCIRMRNALP